MRYKQKKFAVQNQPEWPLLHSLSTYLGFSNTILDIYLKVYIYIYIYILTLKSRAQLINARAPCAYKFYAEPSEVSKKTKKTGKK
jgi:hypothetical protein